MIDEERVRAIVREEVAALFAPMRDGATNIIATLDALAASEPMAHTQSERQGTTTLEGQRPTAPPPPTGQVIEVQPGFSVYTYPLRPNLKITIALPDDLTSKDIARLKKFMETLLPDIDEAATPGSTTS